MHTKPNPNSAWGLLEDLFQSLTKALNQLAIMDAATRFLKSVSYPDPCWGLCVLPWYKLLSSERQAALQ